MTKQFKKGDDVEEYLVRLDERLAKNPAVQDGEKNLNVKRGTVVTYAKSAGGVDYLIMTNSDGETCYAYPNADQNAMTVSSSEPA